MNSECLILSPTDFEKCPLPAANACLHGQYNVLAVDKQCTFTV